MLGLPCSKPNATCPSSGVNFRPHRRPSGLVCHLWRGEVAAGTMGLTSGELEQCRRAFLQYDRDGEWGFESGSVWNTIRQFTAHGIRPLDSLQQAG